MIQAEQNIPSEYAALFAEYVQALQKKCSHIMWVVLNNGHRIEMVEKELHMSRVERLLSTGDDRRVKVAIEVMKRSIGTWRER